MNFAFIRKSLPSLNWLGRRRDSTSWLGRRGERAAAKYLKRHRHRILVRNYRCVAGEIDLICTRDDTIVFVEVKTRSDRAVMDAGELVRPAQRHRLMNAARYFLLQHGAQDRPCCFDLVTVLWPSRGSPRIEHFQDAFQPPRT